eukprot:CAMPEP_0176259940 /NCGR_PEP_ID=MMETSP0121_2-20121125/39328_1 /TAXON_ID=160619 /ORGANISM="Kryptoperidinium foliaceum, Strain CCMP 1326" /LENGTH=30 /DNA_ID= /DNA_START= /DNA_END= /DNA_ORIENTATION=
MPGPAFPSCSALLASASACRLASCLLRSLG